VNLKLEVIVIPVSDVDRAKAFYERLGLAAPGSLRNVYLVVSDIETARADLIGWGIDVSKMVHHDGLLGPVVTRPDYFMRLSSTTAATRRRTASIPGGLGTRRT